MFDLVWRPGLALAGVALIAGLAVTEARAESIQKQCSAKYQAAKAANSLNGETWNQFYKQCAAELRAGGAPAGGAAATPAPTTEAAPPPPEKHRKKAEETAAPAPTGPVVFPTGVSPKYSSETPAKQRFHTCLDQYHANKATNSNGGLRWIEKGGGYYSECNRKLKGA